MHEMRLFDRLSQDFKEAFLLDQMGEGVQVDALHQQSLDDGLSEAHIRRARKAAAVSLITNGVDPV